MLESFKDKTESRLNFEEQWSKNESEKTPIGGKEIEVQDIYPENQKTNIPVIIGLGWSETPQAHRSNIKIMTEQGRRVISPNTPHGLDAELLENYPAVELRKMAALIKTLEAKGVEKADIVAHSEGSIFSVMAAYLYPEKFRNLVLVNPAGMIGKDSLSRLASGFSIDLIRQIMSELTKEKPAEAQTTGGGPLDALKAVNTLMKSPIQAIRSVFAMTNSDVRNMLKDIKGKGIGISVIHSVEDRAFPMEKMQEALGVEHLDGFYSVKGSHNSYFLDPKPYTLLIDNALDDMEKKIKQRLM